MWAETAGTSHSEDEVDTSSSSLCEDEEVSTSSAPLTKTHGGDGMRLYDQVILRAATEAQRSTPQPPAGGYTEKIGGYAREPEARSTRERFRLPPAYGRYRGRAYKARALLLIAYLLRQALSNCYCFLCAGLSFCSKKDPLDSED